MTTQEEDAFDLSRVQLTQTQDWCYHEGSYGYNPEYGSTHILTLASSANATPMKAAPYFTLIWLNLANTARLPHCGHPWRPSFIRSQRWISAPAAGT